MPPLLLCLNEFGGTCLGGRTHTDSGIVFIFANVVFLGMSYMTYCHEMIHTKNTVRERVQGTPTQKMSAQKPEAGRGGCH
jgi:hypothetical protein